MDEKKNVRMVVEEVGNEGSENLEEAPKKDVMPDQETESEVSPKNKEVLNSKDTTEEVKKPEKEEKVKKESSFNILWILIPGMLLLGLLIGGIFAYVFGIQKISDTNIEQSTQTQNATIEPVQSSTPVPSASPSADLSKYKIKILNGSGISGEAGKVQDLVEEAGFSVLSTGNASTYDYTKTEITLKTGIDPDFVNSLVSALEEVYQLDDVKTLSSQTNDITVIVGNLKAI